jgi:DNA repair exonuclease SbcCD ATPase subunit
MDLEDMLNKIETFDDEISSLKETTKRLFQKTSSSGEKIDNYINTVRNLQKEVERLNKTVAGLGGFDSALAQIRKDFNEKIADVVKQSESQRKRKEIIQQDDLKLLRQVLTKMDEKISLELDKRISAFMQEDSRLINKVEEIERKIDEKLQADKELTAMDWQRNTKSLNNIQVELEAVNRRQEEVRNKLEVLLGDMRKNDNRINELYATESDRSKAQMSFMEQQAVLQYEHNKTWQSWQQQFEDVFQRVSLLMGKQKDLVKVQRQFEEINEKFERRTNELTELYRLFEERFNKDWATYKADAEKQRANYSLIFGGKQEGFGKQFKDLKNRLIDVEDNTKELQEVIRLMSSEMRKGMQNLMKMVDRWMGAFGEVRDTR